MAYRVDVKVEEKARLKGHRWQLSDLEFNVDGTVLASASWDKEVRLWDLFTLDTVCVLKDQHQVPVTTLSWFPPDGSLIATGSADNTACLWSADAGEMLVCLKEHFGWIMDSSFSENGSALATASWDKTVRVWDPATGSLLTTLNGHTKGVYGCHYHPSATSNVICSASEDETVRIWDTRMQGNKPMRTMIGGHDSAVTCCRWSPDGKLIATGGADHVVTIWDSREGKVVTQLREHSDSVKSVAFHPGTGAWAGKTMLASAGDTTCCIWDPTELAERDLLCGHVSHGKKEVEAVAFTPDGTVLATGGRDNDIALSFLSVPGASGGEMELTWVKHQTEEKARQLAAEHAEREEEERERQQEREEMFGDDSESESDEDDDEGASGGDDDEDTGVEAVAARMRKASQLSELPVEVQRRQLRQRTPVARRSSAILMSQLRRRSIYGNRSSSGGLASPHITRTNVQSSLSVEEESAYGLRMCRLRVPAEELASPVAYLGNEVSEHAEDGGEDEDIPETIEFVASISPGSHGADEADGLSPSHSSTSSTSFTSVKAFAAVPSVREDLEDVVGSALEGATLSQDYEKTKTFSLGHLPDQTPGLAISMPPSRSTSIHNFFAEADPMPDLNVTEESVMLELDSILGEEEEEDEEEDEDQDIVYGEQPLQYVAAPIKPPPEYIARMNSEAAAAANANIAVYESAPAPLPQSPLARSPVSEGGAPITLRRPTYTLNTTSPPATKKTNDSDSRSDGSGYEEIEDEDSDGSGYEDLDDNKNGEEGEMYEGVDSDVISKLLTPHPASSPGMSTRNDSGISGISRDRGSVNSNASRASNTSNVSTVSSTNKSSPYAAPQQKKKSSNPSSGNPQALKTLLRAAVPFSGVGGGDAIASAHKPQLKPKSQPPSRQPSNASDNSNYASRRLPEVPPELSVIGSNASSLSHSPVSPSSPSPGSPRQFDPPSPRHASRPQSTEIPDRPTNSPIVPRRPTNTMQPRPAGSPRVRPRPQSTEIPDRQAPVAARLPPGGAQALTTLPKKAYLDALSEEKSRSSSAPSTPAVALRSNSNPPAASTPPPTARRPTNTFSSPKPVVARRPTSTVSSSSQATARKPPVVQDEYMAFSSAARQVEVPRGDSGEDDDAKEYMKVEDDDAARSPAQRDDDIIDEDEYMMFDGGNETSMI